MNKLRGVPGFSTSKEEATANALISSFEERDEEQLRAAMKNQTLQFITIDISRMSRKLKIQFSAPQRTNMTSSSLPNPSLPNEQQQGEEQQEADIDPEEDIR
ncbi:putative Gamma-soluble NSF attachment protein (SNAP-gamma) (N-ethylmaleimide-sensitive factor attachment protein, gamma) [Trypanosoma cruzi]|nr:putative Gamma-soluble NSF attachment protein (SNAP-gamma) (N-ethylmaleimide-sensitive factor attachment protein, gamma) [Trypanosoma cruzi]